MNQKLRGDPISLYECIVYDEEKEEKLNEYHKKEKIPHKVVLKNIRDGNQSHQRSEIMEYLSN